VPGRVVSFFSKTLTRAEKNWCVTRQELLAIVKTVEHFDKYLCGQEFHLHTKHSTLSWLLSFRNLEGQTAHWGQRLQKCNFTSENFQGLKHPTHTHSLKDHVQRNALTARRSIDRQAA
jgi:hypothetical protein